MVLKIGPLMVDPPVVLAPMAGVTNGAFRRLCRGFGAGLYVSEMITARAVTERNAKTDRMIARAEGEVVHSVQLYGVDPVVVGGAVRILVEEVGVDHIDLNFGCPATKVTRKGGGAALPAHPVLYRNVVRAAVSAAGSVPVTAKMRMGLNDQIRTDQTAARIAEDEGIAAVALHARAAEQRYSGPADWEAVAALKAAVTSIPVLGNGDIWEAADAVAMMAQTGCDGVVIGRGCLGRPWLFASLQHALGRRPSADPYAEPTTGLVVAVMSRHARLLVDAAGEGAAMRDFRKHTGWYLTGYPVGQEIRRRLSSVSTLSELDDLLAGIDPTIVAPEAARRMPRGHTDGPRPVSLPEGWLASCDDPTPPQGADALVSGG